MKRSRSSNGGISASGQPNAAARHRVDVAPANALAAAPVAAAPAAAAPTGDPAPPLPEDVLVRSLKYLDIDDVPSAAAVSGAFRDALDLAEEDLWLSIGRKRYPAAVHLARHLAAARDGGGSSSSGPQQPIGYKERCRREARARELRRSEEARESAAPLADVPPISETYRAEVEFTFQRWTGESCANGTVLRREWEDPSYWEEVGRTSTVTSGLSFGGDPQYWQAPDGDEGEEEREGKDNEDEVEETDEKEIPLCLTMDSFFLDHFYGKRAKEWHGYGLTIHLVERSSGKKLLLYRKVPHQDEVRMEFEPFQFADIHPTLSRFRKEQPCLCGSDEAFFTKVMFGCSIFGCQCLCCFCCLDTDLAPTGCHCVCRSYKTRERSHGMNIYVSLLEGHLCEYNQNGVSSAKMNESDFNWLLHSGTTLAVPRPLSSYFALVEVTFYRFLERKDKTKVGRVLKVIENLTHNDGSLFLALDGLEDEFIGALPEFDRVGMTVHLIERSSTKQLLLYKNNRERDEPDRSIKAVYPTLTRLRSVPDLCQSSPKCDAKHDSFISSVDYEWPESGDHLFPKGLSVSIIYDHFCSYNQHPRNDMEERDWLWFLECGALFA